jgi:plastocyanin
MRAIKFGFISGLLMAAGLGAAAQAHTFASGVGAPAAAARKTVMATTVNGQFGFSPSKLTVRVGTKVVWKNVSDAPHTVTGKGAWTVNKNLPQGATVSFTFKKVGTYHYYCVIHPYMTATIVVKK